MTFDSKTTAAPYSLCTSLTFHHRFGKAFTILMSFLLFLFSQSCHNVRQKDMRVYFDDQIARINAPSQI